MCGKGKQLVEDPETGEILCGHCGQVSSERSMDRSQEWRTFNSDSIDRKRVGSPTSLAIHDMGLATVIGKTNKDSSGKQLDAAVNSSINRLRTWDSRTKGQARAQRSLMVAFRELGRIRDRMGLSDPILEKTAYIYRKAQDKNLVRGRSSSAILAAAIYIACRGMGVARSLKDVGLATDVTRKAISRGYRILTLELDLKVPLVDPMKCIAKIANQAKLGEKTKRMAINIMKQLIEQEISAGKLPMGLAATVLYMSCIAMGENRTQKQIADAAGVTEVTMRNRATDLRNRLEPSRK